ncbi:MAG: DUF1937 family protein [Candidatus Aenigmatarchaeota archaeon]
MNLEKPLKIYISGPYSGNTPREVNNNVVEAINYYLIILKKGHFPYLPHLTHYPYIYSKEEIPYIVWLIQDAIWLRECDAIFMMPGWEKSRGAKFEHWAAQKIGKKIFYNIDEIPQSKGYDEQVENLIKEYSQEFYELFRKSFLKSK